MRTVPLRDHTYDLDGLLAAVTERTKLVYICHPNNPTGTMNPRAELDAFFERVPEHVLVVVDQAYFEYIDREDYPDAIAEYVPRGRVVVLRTFSKIYGLAGLRVGYAAGPADVCAAMSKVRRPFDIVTTAQVAAVASIGDEAELARRRAVNSAGLPRLEEILRGNGFDPVPAVGNFLFAATGGIDAAELFDALLHEGVIVRPLAGFGAPTAIRVTVGTPEELDFFAAALGNVLARR
jgi:histidinol-phosphate aminotransferase